MTTTPSAGCLLRSKGNKVPFEPFPFSCNLALAASQALILVLVLLQLTHLTKPDKGSLCHVSDTPFSNATFSLSALACCYQAGDGAEYLMHVSISKSMAAGLEHAYEGARLSLEGFACLRKVRRSRSSSPLN